MDLIQRPKKVERSQKNYLTNEKYQDYSEKQFKNIYDYLDETGGNITDILNNMKNLKVYYEAWNTRIDFECPLGHHALIMCSNMAMYLLWNPSDEHHTVSLFGSGYWLTRASNKTSFTLTSSNSSNTTYTIIIF